MERAGPRCRRRQHTLFVATLNGDHTHAAPQAAPQAARAGICMSIYGLWWYEHDMVQLNKAVLNGDEHVELRHRINTWGNVGTILLAQLIATTSLAGISCKSNNTKKDSTVD